jgi:hypothetical protein
MEFVTFEWMHSRIHQFFHYLLPLSQKIAVMMQMHLIVDKVIYHCDDLLKVCRNSISITLVFMDPRR